MNSEKENKAALITFRTNEDLKKKLESMAAKESRTLSNMIVVLLEKAMAEKK